MLLDKWNPKKHDSVPAVRRAVMGAKYRAVRYSFSNEVMTEIAGLVTDYPDILLRNYQFALPRFSCMYLEYSIDHFLKAMGAHSAAEHILKVLENRDRDVNVGYLIDGSAVYCLVDGITTSYEPIADVISGPIVYTINHTHTPPQGVEPLRFKIKDDVWMAWLMGSTLTNDKAHWTNEQANDIRARFRVWVDKNRADRSNDLWTLMAGSAGEIRNLMTLLLWLNQPAGVNLESVKPHRGWHKAREIVYAAHNIVNLNKRQTARSVAASFSERNSPRRHQVGEFWRNFNKTTCEHNWPIYPDDQGRWKCSRCSQWRIRVSEHERGDAGRGGYVTKEYQA